MSNSRMEKRRVQIIRKASQNELPLESAMDLDVDETLYTRDIPIVNVVFSILQQRREGDPKDRAVESLASVPLRSALP